MTAIVIGGWAGLSVLMTFLWWRQTITRNATSVDVAWSMGLAMLSLLYLFFGPGDHPRRMLVGSLAFLWASRLAWYLLTDRVLEATEEDGRYQALRSHWGTKANPYFFAFYQGQAAVAVLFSLPLLGAMRVGPLSLLDVIGAAVWLLAVTGESVADRQLARFRSDPAKEGQVCQSGLWRFSRHPNYFFEWVHWWSYVLIGRGAILTWIGPALMLLFLFRLTGIPYTESQSLRSRGDAYRRYQATTSRFFPWFPKAEC